MLIIRINQLTYPLFMLLSTPYKVADHSLQRLPVQLRPPPRGPLGLRVVHGQNRNNVQYQGIREVDGLACDLLIMEQRDLGQEGEKKQIQGVGKVEGQQQGVSAREGVRKELLAMDFETELIDRALEQTEDLEKAIEIIVSYLEEQDEREIFAKSSVQLVLLVRMDLKMGLGKMAAQCAHATLRSFQLARSRAERDDDYALTFIKWLQSGSEKVVYCVDNEEQLFSYLHKFKSMGIETCHIRDAGRTQIAAGSATVAGIGPSSSKEMQVHTKSLKRL